MDILLPSGLHCFWWEVSCVCASVCVCVVFLYAQWIISCLLLSVFCQQFEQSLFRCGSLCIYSILSWAPWIWRLVVLLMLFFFFNQIWEVLGNYFWRFFFSHPFSTTHMLVNLVSWGSVCFSFICFSDWLISTALSSTPLIFFLILAQICFWTPLTNVLSICFTFPLQNFSLGSLFYDLFIFFEVLYFLSCILILKGMVSLSSLFILIFCFLQCFKRVCSYDCYFEVNLLNQTSGDTRDSSYWLLFPGYGSRFFSSRLSSFLWNILPSGNGLEQLTLLILATCVFCYHCCCSVCFFSNLPWVTLHRLSLHSAVWLLLSVPVCFLVGPWSLVS